MVEDLDLTRRLSDHFTVGEMIRTSHRYIDNTPSMQVLDELGDLCVSLLEPVRQHFGPLWITSGYRCPQLNQTIGGSTRSAHTFGCAADFVSMWGVPVNELVDWIAQSSLPYDQVIDEYSSTTTWVHLGKVRPGEGSPRRQAFTMRYGKYTLR